MSLPVEFRINAIEYDLEALRSIISSFNERITRLEELNLALAKCQKNLENKMSRINYPDKRFNDYNKRLAPKSQRSRPADSKKTSGGTKKGKD